MDNLFQPLTNNGATDTTDLKSKNSDSIKPVSTDDEEPETRLSSNENETSSVTSSTGNSSRSTTSSTTTNSQQNSSTSVRTSSSSGTMSLFARNVILCSASVLLIALVFRRLFFMEKGHDDSDDLTLHF